MRAMALGVTGAATSSAQGYIKENDMANSMGNCVVKVGRYIGEKFDEISRERERDRPDYCEEIKISKEDPDNYGEHGDGRSNIPIGLQGYLSILDLSLDGETNYEERQKQA